MALPTNERELWLSILNQQIDDIRPSLTPEVASSLDRFIKKLYDALDQTVAPFQQDVEEMIKSHGGKLEKKEFVKLVNEKKLEKQVQTLYLKLFDNYKQGTNPLPKEVFSSDNLEKIK